MTPTSDGNADTFHQRGQAYGLAEAFDDRRGFKSVERVVRRIAGQKHDGNRRCGEVITQPGQYPIAPTLREFQVQVKDEGIGYKAAQLRQALQASGAVSTSCPRFE